MTSTWDPPTGPILLPPAKRRGQTGWVVACVAVAALLAVLAFWLHAGADTRSADAEGTTRAAARLDDKAKQLGDGVDADNDALSDPKRTREVTGYLTTAIEAAFSYDYRNLTATEQAVDEHLTGDARCVYDALFDEVERLAPQQHIVLTTKVHEVALTSLTRTDAQALVFIDQTSTRADTQKTAGVGGQFEVHASHDGTRWRITALDMLDQPLFNGKPAPSC